MSKKLKASSKNKKGTTKKVAKKAVVKKTAAKKTAPKKVVKAKPVKKTVAKAKPVAKKAAKPSKKVSKPVIKKVIKPLKKAVKPAKKAVKKVAPKKVAKPTKKVAPLPTGKAGKKVVKPSKPIKVSRPSVTKKTVVAPKAVVKPTKEKVVNPIAVKAEKPVKVAKPAPVKPKRQIVAPTTFRVDETSTKFVKEPSGKFEMEFVIKASEDMVFEFVSTESGLSEWFCDDVNIRNGVFTFTWDGQEQQAKLVKEIPPALIRYQWLDKNDGSYFEFRIQKDELTNDISLIITDFAESKGDEDSARLLWQSQIDKLLHVLGAFF